MESVGHTLADTVKINIALNNIGDLAAVDEVYTRFFNLLRLRSGTDPLRSLKARA